MIILLRGHIRGSFKNDDLYNLIKELSRKFDIQIYIHTWNIVQNNLSWRKLKTIPTRVSNDTIYNYFRDLKPLIKKIIIDDDKKIKLIGNTKGNVCRSGCPRIGWKNMWYGIYTIMKYTMKKNF